MKPISRIILILLAVATLAHSQDESGTDTASLALPAVPTTAHILGEIPDGTPPHPQPPKPRFTVPAKDVIRSKTYQQDGRTIKIQQIKPIDLSPPPVPATAMPGEVDIEYSQRLAEYREDHPKSGLLLLSATVFRSKDSAPRTLVRWWPEGNGGTITFWSSADFALIAGGIQSFVDSVADTHHPLMGLSKVDIARMSELQEANGREYDAPEMPDFAEGKATFQIAGDPPTAEELAVIQSLHDIYNNEFERLRTACNGRERERMEREAYLKAHPPQPKNITLNYWRTEKPAVKGKGVRP